MDGVLDIVGGICLIAGALFALLAGIGVHKFRDPYSRMHAAAKSPTLGLILVAIGAGLTIRTFGAAATLFLVVVLQLLTSPVGTHLAGRAVHLRVDVQQDGPDELARDESAIDRTLIDESLIDRTLIDRTLIDRTLIDASLVDESPTDESPTD